jgi:pilus assembly protein Flp/PilA
MTVKKVFPIMIERLNLRISSLFLGDLMKKSIDLLKTQKGQGLVEYALILTLVAIVIVVILALLGPSIGNVYSDIVDAMGGGSVAAAGGGGGGAGAGGNGGGSEPTPPAPPAEPTPTVAPSATPESFDPVAACLGHNFAQACWTDGASAAYCSGSPLRCHGMGSGGWLLP